MTRYVILLQDNDTEKYRTITLSTKATELIDELVDTEAVDSHLTAFQELYENDETVCDHCRYDKEEVLQMFNRHLENTNSII